MWFQFSQNNSGGVFTGPAVDVVVFADSPRDAAETAQYAGCDPCAGYCHCCGPRWNLDCPTEWDHKPAPNEIGESWFNRSGAGYARVLYVHADFTLEEVM